MGAATVVVVIVVEEVVRSKRCFWRAKVLSSWGLFNSITFTITCESQQCVGKGPISNLFADLLDQAYKLY